MQPNSANVEICGNHEECEARLDQIKLTKGFSAEEPVKGHMVSSFFHILSFPKLKKKRHQLADTE